MLIVNSKPMGPFQPQASEQKNLFSSPGQVKAGDPAAVKQSWTALNELLNCLTPFLSSSWILSINQFISMSKGVHVAQTCQGLVSQSGSLSSCSQE